MQTRALRPSLHFAHHLLGCFALPSSAYSALLHFALLLLAPYCTPLLCLTLPLLALLYSALLIYALLCPALHFSPLLWLGFLSYNCAVIHSVQSCLILPSLSCLFFLARFCSVLSSCPILHSFTLQNSALLMSAHWCELKASRFSKQS